MDVPGTGCPALLLVISILTVSGAAVGFAQTADQHTQSLESSLAEANGTSNYGHVSDENLERAVLLQSGVDVTAATQIDNNRIGARLVTASFNSEYEDSHTASERTAAVRTAIQRLEKRSEQVNERQVAALKKYNRGDITPRQYVAVLARGDAAVRAIDSAATNIEDVGDSTFEYEIQPDLAERIDRLDAEASPISGPIRRDQFRAAIVGFDPSSSIYLETSNEIAVFAMIDDDRYIRSAFDSTGVDVDTQPQLQMTDAIDHITRYYPWTLNTSNRDQAATFNTLWAGNVFSARVPHTQGELHTYVDASTGEVFKEYQIKHLSDLPVAQTYTNRTEKYVLTVNTTHDTGPLEVSLVRRTTGESATASIMIDGTTVGSTGSDGHLWTVDTRGPTTVRVTAADGATFTVEVDPEDLSG
ncbi:DUF7094 domain-containing protein [Halapricum desulfuricans]|uniref:Secreted protein, component of type IV pili likesystem n=1 Tax=Halapricum desulfuricans TaxID=2841257 RepID=A0A897NBY8_9EURY|nr:hypothetical protein [Halapricum desulfuricans]QSG09978.1 Secreted protein, component of type IV pili likesystem [Halapricum desulfuricans]